MNSLPEPTSNMVTRERYMRDPYPVRLGHLASDLVHLRQGCSVETGKHSSFQFIRESMWFIEWVAPDLDPELASELVEMQVELAGWSRNWETIWNDSTRRSEVASQANAWADRILDMSGLLNEN